MTPHQAAAMSHDERRDWCAADDGWKRGGMGSHWTGSAQMVNVSQVWHRPVQEQGASFCVGHPHPDTLDGASRAIPKGWKWKRWNDRWWGGDAVGPRVIIPDTGDEKADLYLLAVRCRMAIKDGDAAGPCEVTPDTCTEKPDLHRMAVLCQRAAQEVKE